jgi:DnaJ-class molecular chaperone
MTVPIVADPCQVLGVSRQASPAEITAAYEALARVFDPSRWTNAGPEIEAEAHWWHALVDAAHRALQT